MLGEFKRMLGSELFKEVFEFGEFLTVQGPGGGVLLIDDGDLLGGIGGDLKAVALQGVFSPLVVGAGAGEGDSFAGDSSMLHDAGLEIEAFELEDGVEGAVEDEVFGDAGEDVLVVAGEPYAVGGLEGKVEFVGGDENGLVLFPGQGAEQAHNLDAVIQVEVGGGLVQEDNGCGLGQGTGDHGHLELTVGELIELFVGDTPDTDAVDGVVDDGAIGGGEPDGPVEVRIAAVGNELADGHADGGNLFGKDDSHL